MIEFILTISLKYRSGTITSAIFCPNAVCGLNPNGKPYGSSKSVNCVPDITVSLYGNADAFSRINMRAAAAALSIWRVVEYIWAAISRDANRDAKNGINATIHVNANSACNKKFPL